MAKALRVELHVAPRISHSFGILTLFSPLYGFLDLDIRRYRVEWARLSVVIRRGFCGVWTFQLGEGSREHSRWTNWRKPPQRDDGTWKLRLKQVC